MERIKRKIRDYIVLLAGLVMSISIFYMFQTMSWNRSFIEANSTIGAASLQLIFIMGSILLSVITIFYIFYANGFLLSIRQREFGLFMVLGARKSKVRSLMFIETVAVGLVSLVAGLVLGFGLSALVAHLMAHQLEVTLSGYHDVHGPSIIHHSILCNIIRSISGMESAEAAPHANLAAGAWPCTGRPSMEKKYRKDCTRPYRYHYLGTGLWLLDIYGAVAGNRISHSDDYDPAGNLSLVHGIASTLRSRNEEAEQLTWDTCLYLRAAELSN
jgi:hypothetical protein